MNGVGAKITLMSVGAGLVAAGIAILTQAPKDVSITGMFLVAAGLVVMVLHEKIHIKQNNPET